MYTKCELKFGTISNCLILNFSLLLFTPHTIQTPTPQSLKKRGWAYKIKTFFFFTLSWFAGGIKNITQKKNIIQWFYQIYLIILLLNIKCLLSWENHPFFYTEIPFSFCSKDKIKGYFIYQRKHRLRNISFFC